MAEIEQLRYENTKFNTENRILEYRHLQLATTYNLKKNDSMQSTQKCRMKSNNCRNKFSVKTHENFHFIISKL
jgi:sporulation-control protein spo0M